MSYTNCTTTQPIWTEYDINRMSDTALVDTQSYVS